MAAQLRYITPFISHLVCFSGSIVILPVLYAYHYIMSHVNPVNSRFGLTALTTHWS